MYKRTKNVTNLPQAPVTAAVIGGAIVAALVALGIIFHSAVLAGGGMLFLAGLFLLWMVMGKPLSGTAMLGLACVILGVVVMYNPLQDIAYTTRNWHYLGSFHTGIEDILSATGLHGDRYVVYDREKGELLSACLPETYRAHALDELAGVFTVETEAIETGYYSGKDKAYTVMQTVTLRSAADGAQLGQKTIYGGDPPELITVDAFLDIFRFWNTEHYGSRPSEAQVREACLEILNQIREQSDL